MTTERYKCQWTIHSFHENFDKRTTIFTMDTDDGEDISWRFNLCPINSDCVMFQIVSEDEDYTIKARRSHLYIENKHGTLKKIKSLLVNDEAMNKPKNEKGWTSYCFSKKYLLHNAELFLLNDKLSIVCEVDIKRRE